MYKYFYLIIGLLFCTIGYSQQTVGTFFNTEASFNGYTLFSPMGSESTYLIDNCGYVVNQWESTFKPGLSVYLLENGNLLRTARIANEFNSGGSSGRVELFSWEGALLWSYNYSSEDYQAHHDIEPMPNGHILILAWEKKSVEEAVDMGRDPEMVSTLGVWPEHIVEINPENDEIVWEWHLWDHLIQDFDNTKENFGVVEDHPELVDINFKASNNSSSGGADWNHANSIDYNATLDQIIINSRNFDEFWIIDHSTTTEEAASHSGGNAGKGGDILYRWGNPQSYRRGTELDRKLYRQHDARWIIDEAPDAGKIMVYNNGLGRPDGNYSSVDIVDPPLNNDGTYAIGEGMPYGPEDLFWEYKADPVESFFSERISGASQLPNGNTLICEGRRGRFFEVTPDGEIVWSYINPASSGGILSQGTPATQNEVFRVARYGVDYPAFDDKLLLPLERIEQNPFISDCVITQESTSTTDTKELQGVYIQNSIFQNTLTIRNEHKDAIQISIIDLAGRIYLNRRFSDSSIDISTQNWVQGMYVVHFYSPNQHLFKTRKIIKL